MSGTQRPSTASGATTSETGIVAMYADSVIIRNSTASRDAVGSYSPYCYQQSMQFVGIGAFFLRAFTAMPESSTVVCK